MEQHPVASALSRVVAAEAERRGISIRTLASQIGIPHVTLARRLNINSPSPLTADEIDRIANAFELKPSDLFLAAEAHAEQGAA